MPDTRIQTARTIDGGLRWSTAEDDHFCYPVGKQRAMVLLGTDLIASYVERALEGTREAARTAVEGWERSAREMARGPFLSDAERRRRSSDIERELGRARERLEACERLDLDGYIYDLARASLIPEASYGQLTQMVKARTAGRKGLHEVTVLRGSVPPSSEPSAQLAVRVSVKNGDLMRSVLASQGEAASVLRQDLFLDGSIIPFTWLFEWFLRARAWEYDLGRASLQLTKAMRGWEASWDGDLRSVHHELVRRACCVRCTIDALRLEGGTGREALQLWLRDDYISSFLPALGTYKALVQDIERLRELDTVGFVVVGMGGSGKTTFLRRCYGLLKDDFGNSELSEEVDPRSTAFVVGHLFRDIELPLHDGSRKRMTLCWMDTAGSEDYRLLGQQLTVAVRDLRDKVFGGRAVNYNLLFVWSYEPGYTPSRYLPSFENVFTRFLEEMENLSYFELEPPRRIYLLLNKADNAESEGVAERFRSDHERCFLSAIGEDGKVPGHSLGFLSALHVDKEEIARKMLVAIFGISEEEWRSAYAGVRSTVNQSIIGGLLPPPRAQDFKGEVYDATGDQGQGGYLRATRAWLDRYLGEGDGAADVRAVLISLRAFLNEVRGADEVA